MIKLYTIGFTKKSAEEFFGLLQSSDIQAITDTRINNTSQLAGFAKFPDIAFFSERVAGIDYGHNTDFAPTKELLKQYRDKKMDWAEYETEYLNLLDLRQIKKKHKAEDLHRRCLLCSEHEPDQCHRRLLAEYFAHARNDVEILHLK